MSDQNEKFEPMKAVSNIADIVNRSIASGD